MIQIPVLARLRGVVRAAFALPAVALLFAVLTACGGRSDAGANGYVIGVVQTADGAPMAGAEVALAGAGSVGFTTSDGNFVVGPVPAGTYTLIARRAGFVDATLASVVVGAGDRKNVGPLTLSPGLGGPVGNISGVVTTSGGTSLLAGVTVLVNGSSVAAVSNGSGAYTLGALLPGTYELLFAKTGFATKTLPDLVVAAGRATAAASVDLHQLGPEDGPLGRVRGRVTRSGAATGNAGTTVYLQGTDRLGTTDDAGNFGLSDVTPGNYTLTAFAAGYRTVNVNGVAVSAGQSTQVATFDVTPSNIPPTGGAVAGRALLLGQENHSGIVATLLGGPLPMLATTGADGTYQFTNVTAGVYRVELSKPLYQTTTVQDVVASVGSYQVPDAILRLPRLIDPRVPCGLRGSWAGQALVSFCGAPGGSILSTSSYDLATGAITPIVPGPMTVLAWSRSGPFASISTPGNALSRANLATGAVDIVAPYAVDAMRLYDGDPNSEYTFYHTRASKLAVVKSSDATGRELTLAQCPSDYWREDVSQARERDGRWADGLFIVRTGHGSSLVGPAAGLQTKEGNLSWDAWGSYTYARAADWWRSTDGRFAFVAEKESTCDSSSTVALRSYELATGTSTTILTGVTGPLHAIGPADENDMGRGTHTRFVVAHAVDAGGLGSLSIIDTDARTATPVASSVSVAQVAYFDHSALIRAGNPAELRVINLLNGAAQVLCPLNGSTVYPREPTHGVWVCLSGTNLTMVDAEAASKRLLSSTASSGYWTGVTGGALTWNEPGGMRVVRLGSAAGPWPLCASAQNPSAWQDGRTLVSGCFGPSGWTLQSLDTETGVVSSLLTSTGTGANWQLSADNKTVRYAWDVSTTPDPWGCPTGSTACVAFKPVAGGAPSTPLPITSSYYVSSYNLLAAAPGGNGAIYANYSDKSLLTVFAGGAQVVSARAPSAPDLGITAAWSPSGDRALFRSYVGTAYLVDLSTAAVTTLRTTSDSARLGSDADWLVGNQVVHLATGVVEPLSADPVRALKFSDDSRAFSYISGTNAGYYRLGSGAAVLAANASYLRAAGSHALLLIGGAAGSGTLAEIQPNTGSLVQYATSVSSAMSPVSINPELVLAWRNANASAAELIFLDLHSGHVASLASNAALDARFSFAPPCVTASCSPARVLFRKLTPAGPKTAVAALDGSGDRLLGPAFDGWPTSDDAGRRFFWNAGGLLWAESAGDPASVAIDAVPFTNSGVLFDHTFLYGVATSSTEDAARNGLYRLELP